MLVRILTVREHKTVVFCDVYCGSFRRKQMMAARAAFPELCFQAGMVLDGEFTDGVSRAGNPVMILQKVYHLYAHDTFFPYKSFQENSKHTDTGAIADLQKNILNGGKAAASEELKSLVLKYICDYLEQAGFVRAYTPVTTAYRGTSTVNPQRAEGEYTGHRFIKITHELGLKIRSYLLLQSVYEVGYVCRDRYATQVNANEFLSIEGVALPDQAFDLKGFFCAVWENTIETAKMLEMDISPDFAQIEMVDFVQKFGRQPKAEDAEDCFRAYEKLAEEKKHFIVTNAPIDSPFVYAKDGFIPLETKWFYHGKGIGHGYADEYRAQRIVQVFERQKELLALKGIRADMPLDFMQILGAAGIPTDSFVIGVERLIQDAAG